MDTANADVFPDPLQHPVTSTIISVICALPQRVIRDTQLLARVFTGLSAVREFSQRLVSMRWWRREKRIGTLLGSGMGHIIPGLVTVIVAGHDVPVPQPSADTIDDYRIRRKLIKPHFFSGMQHIVDGTPPPIVTMPPTSSLCLRYLRLCLLNSPTHWTVETGDSGKWWALDATPSLDVIESAPMGCIYNVRKIRLAEDCSWVTFEVLNGSTWEWRADNPKTVADQEKLQTFIFFTLVLMQQLSETCYHNWVHFYFNDVVLYQVKSTFPAGHWVRTLLDPHMRYQEVLNQAGMFSRGPNDPKPQTLLDDVLYPGMLSNWPLDNFQRSIVDYVLGYYKGADHSHMARTGKAMGFDLKDILNNRHTKTHLPQTPMHASIDSLQLATRTFVHGIVEQHGTADADRMCLFNRSVLRYLDPGAADTCGSGIQETFATIVSRYILNVGHMHGLEHYFFNIAFAPLRLPQRIREVYTPGLARDAYFHRTDALNGMYGHRIYTRYRPGPTEAHEDWENIQYTFADMASNTLAAKYVTDVRKVHALMRDEIVAKFRAIWDLSNIDWSYDQDYLGFGSRYIGLSICM